MRTRKRTRPGAHQARRVRRDKGVPVKPEWVGVEVSGEHIEMLKRARWEYEYRAAAQKAVANGSRPL